METATVEHGGVTYVVCPRCRAVLDDGQPVRCEQVDGFWYHYKPDGERVPRHVVAFVSVGSIQ